MKIGNTEFKYGIFLAPMAGITDAAFRHMCVKYGVEGVFTEMISSRALCYNDRKTKLLAKIMPDERPCFLQIFGNDPEVMAKSAVLALEFNPDIIDINMGCPAPKVVGNGDGSAIMKKPILAYEIVKEVRAALPKNISVTVKMRSGYDISCRNAVEMAEICEKAGAGAVTVHGRTREQMYAPPVDRDIIREVKRSVGIPVIANGDITGANSAEEMLEYTKCDGIMVGRGALGNPYVFDEIKCRFSGTIYQKPSSETLRADITEHITRLVELKGEEIGSREARKHVAWYLKGMKGAAGFRDEVNRAVTLEEVLSIINRAVK